MPGLVVNRKQIKDALLALGAAATFSTAIAGHNTWASTPSRRLKLWDNVDPSAQPAMFLVQHREGYMQYGSGRLTRRYLDMGFWCYARSGEDLIGDDLLDIMETGLEAALQPNDHAVNELTLGGLVQWVRITREEGVFIRDPGDIDGQALLVLPVRILIP